MNSCFFLGEVKITCLLLTIEIPFRRSKFHRNRFINFPKKKNTILASSFVVFCCSDSSKLNLKTFSPLLLLLVFATLLEACSWIVVVVAMAGICLFLLNWLNKARVAVTWLVGSIAARRTRIHNVSCISYPFAPEVNAMPCCNLIIQQRTTNHPLYLKQKEFFWLFSSSLPCFTSHAPSIMHRRRERERATERDLVTTVTTIYLLTIKQ